MTDHAPDTEPMVTLLDLVHAALLAADYGRLGSLTDSIEAELARPDADRDAATMARVQAKARRNEACLQAAQRGFRAARRRIEEIKAARSGLITYDTRGRRAEPHRSDALVKRF